MLRNIVHDTKKSLLKHPKLIKYSFFYTFFHSIIVLWFIVYNTNNILYYRFENGISVFTMAQYFTDKIKDYGLRSLVIIGGALVAIGYLIIYPIGISTIIHFIHKGFKDHSKSIGGGLKTYFTMTEFNGLAFSFGAFTFFTTVARLYSLEILYSTFALILIIIWGLVVIIASLLRNYAKYYIALRNMGVYEAIKNSVTLTFNNFATTCIATLYQFILYIYFLIRISIILIIPASLLYLFIYLEGTKGASLETILRILGTVLVIITIYLGSVIGAYFNLYWYKIFTQLESKE